VSVPRRLRSRIVEDATAQARASINGTEIAYRVRPTADRPGAVTLLVLHGFTGQGGDWATVCDQLAESGHGSICPDHPGHGGSAAPDDPAPYTMQAMADMYRVLCDRLTKQPVVVLGHSMGGAVAEQFALRHADRMRALVLVDSIGGSRRENWVRALDGYAKPKLQRIAFEEGMGALYDYQVASGRRIVDHIPEPLRPLVRDHFAQTSAVGYFHAAAAMRDRDSTLEGLAELTAPALVLEGESEDAEFVAAGRELHAALPDCRFAFIEGAAHNPHFEAPQATASLIAEFLMMLGPGPA